MKRGLLGLVFSLLLLLVPVSGQEFIDDLYGQEQEVSGIGMVDQKAVPAGKSCRVVLVLKIAEGWHIYGNPVGPGVGEATRVEPVAQAGFKYGQPLFSPAHREEQADLGKDMWVWSYTKEARVYCVVETGATLKPGTHILDFKVIVTACQESCIQKELSIPVALEVATPGAAVIPANEIEFKGFGQAKPGGKKKAPAQTAPTTSPTAAKGSFPLLSPAEVTREIEKFTARSEGEIGSLWWAILFGFIAGIILNIMPCVLPVISIKILSFVQQAGEDRGRVFKLGLSFSGGILFVFLILAGLAAFAGQSWGAQFQSTGFLVSMIALVFAFSLAMFDLYVFALPGFVNQVGTETREGYLGAFSKGMLATVLATPCSGPFLGSTLAWVVGQPPLIVFTIFTSIGLGMALPYVILTANPAFLKIVPKPGAWMARFKELMGFVLLGTVVYLLTIVPSDQVVWVVAFCLFIATGAWIYGKITGPWKPRAHRFLWRSVAVGVIVLGGWLSFGVLMPLYTSGEYKEKVQDTFMSEFLWHLAKGETVVVDWTADWCPNCKFVEKAVLHSAAVTKKMEAKGVYFMIADITRKRPLVEALMNKLGSQSIPFLGIFPGNDKYKPWVLRDIYSQQDLLEILDRCP